MFILKKGHQPGVYVPLRALFLVVNVMKALIPNLNNRHYLLTKKPATESLFFQCV